MQLQLLGGPCRYRCTSHSTIIGRLFAHVRLPAVMDLAPTLAMLGRLLLAHQPLQASLEQDLPLQRQLLRPLLRVAVPPAGQPETITWDGDCEDASQVLCSPGLAPALREQSGSPQGLRTLQAALRLLQQPLPDASQQADAEQLEEAQHAVSKHTARLQLFATLVCAALQGSASQQRDATVACLWAEGQAAAVAAVRGWRALLDAPGLELQHLSDHLGAALGAVVRSAFAVDTSLFRGRRGLRAALSGTSASVCLVWQLLQLSLPAAAGGPRHADMLPSAEAVASALCAVTLGLGHAVEQCSKAVAAAADGSDLMEQLRLVWQEHAAACCLMRSMAGQPADDAAHMMMLLNACNLACQLLGAAVFLADACSNGAEADVQRWAAGWLRASVQVVQCSRLALAMFFRALGAMAWGRLLASDAGHPGCFAALNCCSSILCVAPAADNWNVSCWRTWRQPAACSSCPAALPARHCS